jgi:2-dehydro-3-deoxyglucarate aldolase/4-hydroxy-2-oxoheptanedioate aldolase
MKENRFQRILREGRMPLGHMIMEFGTRGIAKILEAAGLDYVIIDMEHTGFDPERIADLMAWFKATDIAPFVRVPQGFYHFLARTMDAGALGVMVGNVETGEQAKAVVDGVKYAPLGKRGVGLGTAHNDYVIPDAATYFDYANRNTTVICQIESVWGLANVEAIAATEGVDLLWVGHYDLSQSMQICGRFDHPEFRKALEKVVEAARRHGKIAALQPGNLQQARDWFSLGFRVLSWKTDIALYRAALQQEIQALRELTGKTGTRSTAAL